MSIHVYREPSQPATRYRIVVGYPDCQAITLRNAPLSQIRCGKCRKLRWAKHLRVLAYYDAHRFFCAPGKGCKRGSP